MSMWKRCARTSLASADIGVPPCSPHERAERTRVALSAAYGSTRPVAVSMPCARWRGEGARIPPAFVTLVCDFVICARQGARRQDTADLLGSPGMDAVYPTVC